MFNFSLEEIFGFVTVGMSIVGTLFGFFWKKIYKPFKLFIKEQEECKKTLQIIKSEVTENGGGSIKDTVLELKKTCKSIEQKQVVIDQRSKACLHYISSPLFETSSDGKLIWCNNIFIDFMRIRTEDTVTSGDLSDYNWVCVIDEDDRISFLEEYKSCFSMGRKINIDTKSVRGENISFVGYPYKGVGRNEGFLIRVILD